MGDTKYYRKTDASAAVKWDGENLKEVLAFTGKHPNWSKWFASFEEYAARVRADGGVFKIISKEFVYEAVPGDWIVRSLQGYNYVMKSDVFAATFVPALDAAEARDVGVPDALADYAAARKYAAHLAQSLREQHYPNNTTWQPMPDLLGLLTQIDNMAAGALHPASPLGAVAMKAAAVAKLRREWPGPAAQIVEAIPTTFTDAELLAAAAEVILQHALSEPKEDKEDPLIAGAVIPWLQDLAAMDLKKLQEGKT